MRHILLDPQDVWQEGDECLFYDADGIKWVPVRRPYKETVGDATGRRSLTAEALQQLINETKPEKS